MKLAELQKDNNAVTFLNLHCGLSIDGNGVFSKGEFTFESFTYVVSGKQQGIISGLVMYCDDPTISSIDSSIVERGNEVNQYLRRMYLQAEEIITAITGKYHTFAFFDKPITCVFRDEEYVLNDAAFGKKGIPVFRFPRADSSDLSFLNTRKNPRKYFHMYRLANDPTLTIDQRILMAWRFLENYLKRKDGDLVNYLTLNQFTDKDGKIVKFRRDRVRTFFKCYRSAVAHASGTGRPGQSKKVIYPKAAETTFHWKSRMQLQGILHAIDVVIAHDKRVY